MSHDVKLLPCPCGAPCNTEEGPYPINHTSTLYRLDCENPDCGWSVISTSLEEAMADWNTRAPNPLLAENERLAEALRLSADALERLAFAMPAPNQHTPQLVEMAIHMRRTAALDQEGGNG